MKFEEVLKACARGTMPKVCTSEGDVGEVITIENEPDGRKISVRFPTERFRKYFYEKMPTYVIQGTGLIADLKLTN